MAARPRVSRVPRRESARPSAFAIALNYTLSITFIIGMIAVLMLIVPVLIARHNAAPLDPASADAVGATPTQRTFGGSSNGGGGSNTSGGAGNLSIGNYNATSAAQFATASSATTAITPTAVATPTPVCRLITWADGAQDCDDGRPIDAAHSQPGYCTPITWDDGSVSCNDGKPSGKVVWPDVELQAEPTNTPWPAAPTNDVTWSASDGPSGNTCVTVTFGDGHAQTACSDPNVKLDADDQAFVARLIQDGKIAPGSGTPKG